MPLTPELIAALRKPPQDPERFFVLADRLQSEGDPRGELIMLQARIAEDPDSTALRAAETALLQKHDRALLGKLWKSPSSHSLTWGLGFIRQASLWVEETEPPVNPPMQRQDVRPPRRRTGKLMRLTKDLLELESAALLEELSLALPRPQGAETQLMLDALVEVARDAPPTLEVLRVRDLVNRGAYDEYGDYYQPPGFDFPYVEAPTRRELRWRGRQLIVETDSFLIDVVADLLGAWEPLP